MITNQSGTVAESVAIGLDVTERKQMQEELKRHSNDLEELVGERTAELAALDATVLEITRPHELPALLKTIVERAVELLKADSGEIYVCHSQRGEVRCVVAYNMPTDPVGVVMKYGEGAAGMVAYTGQPLIIDDYRTYSKRSKLFEKAQPFRVVLSVPMIWQGQVAGVIDVISNKQPRKFTHNDLRLLTRFASHAAIAVERQKAEEERKQMHDRLLTAERLAAIGETATMVGHDLRNPLQGMATASYNIRKRLSPQVDQTTMEMLRIIEQGIEHSNKIVSNSWSSPETSD
jgi:C4-dicarboxylate-specific signal transduction histidine kinase